jgi:ribosomal protein L9
MTKSGLRNNERANSDYFWKKIVNLASLGDIVKVRDCYARNFLAPNKDGAGARALGRMNFHFSLKAAIRCA